jgi:hypothetical protein
MATKGSLRKDEIDPALERSDVRNLLSDLAQSNVRCVPKTLRLKNYVNSDVSTQVIDAIFNALLDNEFVEALYCHNFENGMTDPQIDLLIKVLKKGRIWCLNVGENFRVSRDGWTRLADSLGETNVTHIYVSEHIISSEMKKDIIATVRRNRLKDVRHLDYGRVEMINKIGQMWWNPRLRTNHVLARHSGGCWKCAGGVGISHDPYVRCSNIKCEFQAHRSCISMLDGYDDLTKWECERHRSTSGRINMEVEKETHPLKEHVLRQRCDLRGKIVLYYENDESDWLCRVIRRWKYRDEKKERWEVWYVIIIHPTTLLKIC